MKKTKIISTIGPSSIDVGKLEEMHEHGMDCIRINTAYDDQEHYEEIISNTRKVADIPIILDIKGPEIRLHAKEKKVVKNGDSLEIGCKDCTYSFNHDIYNELETGDEFFIDNGKIKAIVIDKKEDKVKLSILEGGEIFNGKGVNFPGKHFLTPSLTKKDKEMIKFSREKNIDYLAYSFTRNEKDIEKLKQKTKNFDIGIIAKIENLEGLSNFEKILNTVDCIMIARGDLGIEISLEKVPMAQKMIIQKCNEKGKTVITATEMLGSMMTRPYPTRAEVSDVANAILDGTDAVMLSGETSIGEHPIKSVKMITSIAKEVKPSIESRIREEKSGTLSETISKAIQRICRDKKIDKIVSLTRSGFTARMISRFKLSQPIIATTPSEKVRKRLELAFGVTPIQFNYLEKDKKILSTTRKLISTELIQKSDTVLFSAALATNKPHASNLIEIHEINDLLNAK